MPTTTTAGLTEGDIGKGGRGAVVEACATFFAATCADLRPPGERTFAFLAALPGFPDPPDFFCLATTDSLGAVPRPPASRAYPPPGTPRY